MNWALVLQYVVGGALVSWPPVIAGFWVGWRKTRRHVDRRAAEQDELLENVTAGQTAELLAARRREYHEHEHEQDSP